jgi:hypothetical protein
MKQGIGRLLGVATALTIAIALITHFLMFLAVIVPSRRIGAVVDLVAAATALLYLLYRQWRYEHEMSTQENWPTSGSMLCQLSA